jgi:hypothetical protein
MDARSTGVPETVIEIPAAVVFDAVEAVLSEVAAEELPLLAGLRTLDEAQVRRRLAAPRKREDPLGFGLEETMALLTPVVWDAVKAAAGQAAGKVGEQAATGLMERLRALRRRRRRQPEAALPKFTDEQLAAIHERVRAAGLRGGLDEDRAQLFADSVVGQLALPSSSQD